jgi:hypothetical protein
MVPSNWVPTLEGGMDRKDHGSGMLHKPASSWYRESQLANYRRDLTKGRVNPPSEGGAVDFLRWGNSRS